MRAIQYTYLAGLLTYFRFDMKKSQSQRVNKIINHVVIMKWSRSQAQPLGAFWHCWIIYRLDINLMFVQKKLTNSCAIVGIVNHDRYNMCIPLKYRQVGRT